MKKMKNVLMIAVLLASSTVFAQQGPQAGREMPGKPSMNHGGGMIEQLNLTAEQKAKLDKIRKDADHKDSVAFADFRKQQEQMKIDRMTAFKSVLSKEQLKEFDKMLLLRADRAIFKDGGKPGKDFRGQGRMRQGGPKNGFQKMDMKPRSARMQHPEASQEMGMPVPQDQPGQAPDQVKESEKAKE
jgi:LTXXQ motif.